MLTVLSLIFFQLSDFESLNEVAAADSVFNGEERKKEGEGEEENSDERLVKKVVELKVHVHVH